MKDKRLDALLETMVTGKWRLNPKFLECAYYRLWGPGHYVCYMAPKPTSSSGDAYWTTNCQGDIRKCEREK